jgi:putative transposase
MLNDVGEAEWFSIARRSGRSTLKHSSAQLTMAGCFIAGSPPSCITTSPPWVETGALFHIRIAIEREKKQSPLTAVPLAQVLLDSARFYEIKQRWYITLFQLMPDHLHAILSFASNESMSDVIGDWKHFQKRNHGIIWQEGFFDHRLRDDERGEQLSAKMDYIRQNPVVAGLCASVEDWPWIIDRSARGGSSRPLLDAKTMRLRRHS